MAIDRGKLLERFLQEARERRAAMENGLVSMESNPAGVETLDAICRAAHTIKGSSRMMKFPQLSSLAHRMEDVLDALKRGDIACDTLVSSLLFKGVDAIGGMLDRIAAGDPQPAPADELCAQLELVARGESGGERDDDAPADAPSGEPSADLRARAAYDDTFRVSAEKIDGLIRLMGEVSATENRSAGTLSRLRRALRLCESLAPAPGGSDATRLDELRGVLADAYSSLKHDLLSRDTLTRRMLDISLALRTLPLATVFDAFPRAVRDIAVSLGKEVELHVEGGDIELDKIIIEKIGDPLLHMLRNALDHGIETREERLRVGKVEKGALHLSAWLERGSVMILLRDDGRGISMEKIRARALRRNLADRKTLDAMSDDEVREFIFLPGFSTSEFVTDLSGRGVGLDVVRKSIVEELRGSIRINSREGAGTSFHLKLPMNLALFRLLFVSAGGMEFAFPADAVEEALIISRDELIKVVDKNAFRLRNEVIPVEDLADLLSLPRAGAGDDADMLIAIVSTGKEKLGLSIDEVINEESAAVKPLPSHLKGIRVISGVTVRGRGKVVAVLSAPRLCAAARESKGRRPVPVEAQAGRAPCVLVVDDSISTREIEKSILEAHGYQVIVAGDGLEALERTSERVFDAIVTDIEMPRLDGFSLTERLREDERHMHTPIIIVTSREREEDRKRGIMVGANAYIVKGAFDQGSLVETIENLIA